MRPEALGTYYESILDKEVRKEGGIYYTPSLIVDYMVENSLGALLKHNRFDWKSLKTASLQSARFPVK